MVIYDSYITRKPMEFTLIALFVLLVILLPFYFYTSRSMKRAPATEEILAVSFNEANFLFSPESELSDKDKKYLFTTNYEGRIVQWTGKLQTCDPLGVLFRVGIDHTGNKVSDALFTTYDDCTNLQQGDTVSYRMRLIDWKINKFIGKEGAIIHGP